jgi:hypothetical protein
VRPLAGARAGADCRLPPIAAEPDEPDEPDDGARAIGAALRDGCACGAARLSEVMPCEVRVVDDVRVVDRKACGAGVASCGRVAG